MATISRLIGWTFLLFFSLYSYSATAEDKGATKAAEAQEAASTPASTASAVALAGSAPKVPKEKCTAGCETKSEEQKKDDDSKVDWIARWIAIVGGVIAIFNTLFAIWKIARDRRLSVEDDFWFRKIVSPATIEPMLKSVTGLLDKAPGVGANRETIATFALEVTTEFLKLYSTMHTLALYEQSLPDEVNDKLSACEDLFTDYCAELANEGNQSNIDILKLRNRVIQKVNESLAVVKSKHLKR